MSADTVTLKIEEKAKESAKVILEEAKKEADKKREAVIADAALREEKIISNAEFQSDVVKKGILQNANAKRKLDTLKEETLALEKVKESAKATLLEKDCTDIFIKYMKESLLDGEYTLVPSSFHREILEKNLKKIEKEVGISLKISQTDAAIDSGFMLQGEIYDVDFSLDAIIDETFEKSKKEIHSTLFN